MHHFRERDTSPELMDDLNCEGEVVDQTLHELDIINRHLGGTDISLQGLGELLKGINDQIIRLADLGCGSGEMIRKFIDWSKKEDLHLDLVGIDANPYIVEYARKHLKGVQDVSFKTKNVLAKDFSRLKFDVIHCSLFLHHFTEEELVLLLQNFKRQSRIGVVVNDLHRHWLAYYSIKYLTRFFSKSSMVKYDAPLSVARAFRKAELMKILDKAGIQEYKIKWKWAFRWQLVFRS